MRSKRRMMHVVETMAKIEKIDRLVSLLHDETDDKRRGEIYAEVHELAKPCWFSQAMAAAAWSVYFRGLPFGIVSPLSLMVGENAEYAEDVALKLGARQQDFDVCYRLCVEMQWDLLDGENVDVIASILNEREEEVKQGDEFWQKFSEKLKKMDWNMLTNLLERTGESKDNPIYKLTVRELKNREIRKHVDRILTLKVLHGKATREEYEAWQLHEQYGIPYYESLNIDEVFDEDEEE